MIRIFGGRFFNMKKFCGHGISKSTLPILLKFLSGLDEVIPCGQKQPVWNFHVRRPSNVLRKKKYFNFSRKSKVFWPTLRISEMSLLQYPKMINILWSIRYIPYSAREAREKFLGIRSVSKAPTLLCARSARKKFWHYRGTTTRKKSCYCGVLQLFELVATTVVLQKKTLLRCTLLTILIISIVTLF